MSAQSSLKDKRQDGLIEFASPDCLRDAERCRGSAHIVVVMKVTHCVAVQGPRRNRHSDGNMPHDDRLCACPRPSTT